MRPFDTFDGKPGRGTLRLLRRKTEWTEGRLIIDMPCEQNQRFGGADASRRGVRIRAPTGMGWYETCPTTLVCGNTERATLRRTFSGDGASHEGTSQLLAIVI